MRAGGRRELGARAWQNSGLTPEETRGSRLAKLGAHAPSFTMSPRRGSENLVANRTRSSRLTGLGAHAPSFTMSPLSGLRLADGG